MCVWKVNERMLPDYYSILGVHPAASLDEIKQAFRSLARQYHPDMHPDDATANEHFRAIYEAYRVLSTPELRAEYNQQRAQQYTQPAGARFPANTPHDGHFAPQGWNDPPSIAPDLELRCILSHTQVPIYPREQLIYVLSELIPVSDGQLTSVLPLNLCLAIDRSSSMRGEKLRAVKQALRSLVARLQPADILSIVVFDNRAEVIARAEPQQVPDVLISTIEQLVERGGTELGQGLEAALDEVRRFSRQPMVSHIILLTDGQTYGDEARCLELAFQARQEGIAITALGVGTKWNEHLLDHIADLSDGMADYLASASDITTALDRRINALRNTLATNVRLSLQLEGGVRLRRVTRVVPDIAELMDAAPAGQDAILAREAELNAGIISAASQGCSLALLWEVVLPASTSGRYRLGHMSIHYDIPHAKLPGQQKSESLTIEFVDPHFLTPMSASPHVKRVIEYVTAYRVQNKAQELARQGDHTAASQLMHTAALRLRDAAQEDLAKQAQEQAELLAQQQAPTRASILKLKYATKNLHWHQRT